MSLCRAQATTSIYLPPSSPPFTFLFPHCPGPHPHSLGHRSPARAGRIRGVRLPSRARKAGSTDHLQSSESICFSSVSQWIILYPTQDLYTMICTGTNHLSKIAHLSPSLPSPSFPLALPSLPLPILHTQFGPHSMNSFFYVHVASLASLRPSPSFSPNPFPYVGYTLETPLLRSPSFTILMQLEPSEYNWIFPTPFPPPPPFPPCLHLRQPPRPLPPLPLPLLPLPLPLAPPGLPLNAWARTMPGPLQNPLTSFLIMPHGMSISSANPQPPLPPPVGGSRLLLLLSHHA